MSSGGGSALTTEYIYFPDISATTPVASLKLMSGGCAYNCDFAEVQLIYDNDNVSAATQSYCSA